MSSPYSSFIEDLGGTDPIPSLQTRNLGPEIQETPKLLDFITQIQDLAKQIITTITANKSVTAENKRSIINNANEIDRLTYQAAAAQQLNGSLASFKNEIKQVITEELSKIQKPAIPQSQVTFASILKRQPPATKSTPTSNPTITKPALIVKSKKDNANKQDTKESWRNAISFKNYSFAPSKVIPISKNKLRVEFETIAQRDETLKQVMTSDEIEVETAKKLKPMFILKGVYKETPSEELTEILLHQNPFIKDALNSQEDIKLAFVKNNKKMDLYNAVFTVSPMIWKVATNSQKLNVDHQRVHVADYLPFRQCFKCLQFGHTKAVCKEENIKCSHCASSGHAYSDCPDKNDRHKIKCLNCDWYNAKYNTNSGTKHSATSLTCPQIQTMRDRISRRVDYGY